MRSVPCPTVIARIAAPGLVVLSLLAGGCGTSPEDEVRQTLRDFGEAIAEKDYQRLCDRLFSQKLVAEVRQSLPCEVALQRSEIPTLREPKLDVKSVKVQGDTATAEIRTSAANQKPSEDTIRLVKERDAWRIIALAS
jgi:hypothetical protein